MLRGAIIGFGNIAVRGHVPAYRLPEVKSRLEIAAVMDVVPSSRQKAGEHLPDAQFYGDVQSMLDSEALDFVDICTPPHTHGEYIRLCASRGIHVLCEKPLAENYTSALGIAESIRSAGIIFVPCHQYKYSPLWRMMKETITAGILGQVTLAQFNVYRLRADSGTSGWNPEWRTDKKTSGGGILVDTGAHYFYLTQSFFGIPRQVSAILRTLKHRDYRVEDTAMVALDYSETLVQINLTWASNHRANSVFVAGTAGGLSYDGVRLLVIDASGTREIPMPDVADKNQYVAWYGELLKEFACRIEGKNASTDLLDESVMVMRLLDLCYRSSEENAILGVA